jgi:hypothetical protein
MVLLEQSRTEIIKRGVPPLETYATHATHRSISSSQRDELTFDDNDLGDPGADVDDVASDGVASISLFNCLLGKLRRF